MSLNNEDIKQLIAILQRGLSSDEEDSINIESTTKKSPKIRNPERDTKKKRSSKQKSSAYNKFDAMPEHNMHRDDSKIDQLLIKYPPTQRSREFEHIDVVCRVCGRKESVNPVLVHESPNRYKCNKCAKIPG